MVTASPELERRPYIASSPLFNPAFGCGFAASPLSTHGSHDEDRLALTSAVSAAFSLPDSYSIEPKSSAPTTNTSNITLDSSYTCIVGAAKPVSRSSTSSSSSPHSRAVGEFEPLTFEKLPIAVSSGGNTATAASTDSEMVSDSCCGGAGSGLSRSPSLLTSLIQSQRNCRFPSRQSSMTASSRATPTLVTPPGSSCGARPILRRASLSATSDDGWISAPAPMAVSRAGLPGLGLVAVPESGSVPDPVGKKTSEVVGVVSESQIKTLGQRRRSCLTFAVTPSRRSPSPASRPRQTTTSSSPPTHLPSLADDEEFFTDSDDAGYQEDEEDGFDSDNDIAGGRDASFVPCPVGSSSRQRGSTVPWPNEWAPPILRTPTPRRRQTAPIEWLESTDDAEDLQSIARPSRRRVRVAGDISVASDKCSRHRSPPPSSRNNLGPEPAPPAARSPSAFDLCRRRRSSARHHDDASLLHGHCSHVHPSGTRSDAPAYALKGSAISFSASSNNNCPGNHMGVPSQRAQGVKPTIITNTVKPIPILQNST